MFRQVPWWMAVVAGSFLVCFGSMTALTVNGPKIGIYQANVRGTVVIDGVIPHSSAETAGILPGDRLLRVNGQSIGSRFDWIVVHSNLTSEHPANFEIVRDGQHLNITLTPQRTSWADRRADERLRFILSKSGQSIMLALACLMAFARPRNGAALIGALLLATMTIATPQLLPTGGAAAWRELPAVIGALLWIPAIVSVLGSALLFTFCATFPRKLIRAQWIWALLWTPPLLTAIVLGLFGYHAVYDPAHAIGLLPDWTFAAVSIYAITYFIGGIVAMVLNYRRLSDVNERRRVRVLVLGVVVGLTAAVPQVLPLMLGLEEGLIKDTVDSVPYVVLSTILVYWFFPLSFVYSVLRHRLFDIRIIVRQGLQYAMARRVLLSIMPALVALLILDLAVHSDQPLAAILKSRGWFYAGFVFFGGIVYRRRQIWLDEIDRRFFREHYDAQLLLREVIEEVKEAKSLDSVSASVLTRIHAALHPEFVALLRCEKDGAHFRSIASAPADCKAPQLRADGKLVQLLRLAGKPIQRSSAAEWLRSELDAYKTIELLVPIGADSILALGQKRSEEPYSLEDESLLSTVATSLAMLSGQAPAREAGTAPGRLANRYRLDECIGRGGMGAVYAGFDEALDRPVAIKLIHQELAGDSELAERFRQEAKSAAGIAHRNVVTIFDFGVERRQPFIVMELLAGRTLRAELDAERTLSAKRTLEILGAVCDAVEEAHERHLIHRDLKPENIFIARTPSGELVKVLDFGLAKVLLASSLSNAPTAASVIAGTPHYMAPEQLMGESASFSWDLWALAVIAHEMLTGQRPSLGAAVAPTFALQQFFKKVLDPDPARRLPSVRAFRSELEIALA